MEFYFCLKVLGTCELFEERQVGNERFNIFSGCPSGQTATIVLRGGADQVCHYLQLHISLFSILLINIMHFSMFSSSRKLNEVYMMQS